MNEKYVVEWSHSQACFHIDTWKSIQERNLMAYIENRHSDYIILFVADTHLEAHKICEDLKKQDCPGATAHRAKWDAILELLTRGHN